MKEDNQGCMIGQGVGSDRVVRIIEWQVRFMVELASCVGRAQDFDMDVGRLLIHPTWELGPTLLDTFARHASSEHVIAGGTYPSSGLVQATVETGHFKPFGATTPTSATIKRLPFPTASFTI